MSELSHPPVDFGVLQDLTPEEQLAQEAFSILFADSNITPIRIDDTLLPILKTDAVDLAGKEDDYVSLRLKSVPVLIIDTGNEAQTHTDAANYYVIDIEHRQSPEYAYEDEYEPEDEAPGDWSKYIRIIINTLSTQEVMVLDGQTHVELTPEEIGIASYIVNLMRHEFRDSFFDEYLRSNAEDQAQNVIKLEHGKFAPFDSTDFLQVSICEPEGCGTVNEACEHNPYTLN